MVAGPLRMACGMSQPSKDEPRLLDRVRESLRVRHLSLKTEKAYLHWIRRFILFHGKRHPQQMGETEVNAFLTHLAVKRKVSPSTQTQALCALVYLYKIVLEKELGELEGLKDCTGVTGSSECEDDHDLHPCPEPRGARNPESRGYLVTLATYPTVSCRSSVRVPSEAGHLADRLSRRWID